MADIVIYTKSYDPHSLELKKFLEAKGVSYDEQVVDNDTALEKEMEVKSGRTDTPQVFINGHHIGSGDDLKALDETGKLDDMLDLFQK